MVVMQACMPLLNLSSGAEVFNHQYRLLSVCSGLTAESSHNGGPCTCADEDDNYANVFIHFPSDDHPSGTAFSLLLISLLLVVQNNVAALHTVFMKASACLST